MTTVKKSLILMAIAMTSLISGCEQERVDAQMQELCNKDGGMKIYEKVVLPKEEFTVYGDVKFFRAYNTSGGGYRFVSLQERLRTSKPTLTKKTYKVIREADNKVLGIYVSYQRIGGAIMPRLGPDPAKQCPAGINDIVFLRTIFSPSK